MPIKRNEIMCVCTYMRVRTGVVVAVIVCFFCLHGASSCSLSNRSALLTVGSKDWFSRSVCLLQKNTILFIISARGKGEAGVLYV